jgi:hypothetical protein
VLLLLFGIDNDESALDVAIAMSERQNLDVVVWKLEQPDVEVPRFACACACACACVCSWTCTNV